MPNLRRGKAVLAVAPTSDMEEVLGRLPSLGIFYLAAALEDAGFPVALLDRQYERLSPSDLATEIMAYSPALVGFTLYDSTMEFTHRTIRQLRQYYRGPIIVGGYTPTFHAEEILAAWPEVEFVIVREGEVALVQLMEHLAGKRSIDQVSNLVYRQADAIRSNPELPLVNVNSLRWPRRDWPEAGDVTPIVTRRGCTSRCSFCSMVPFYDTTLGPVVRLREPEDVVAEIAACIDHGAAHFMLYDDDFSLATKGERAWVERFIEQIRQRDLRFHFSLELRIIDVLRGTDLLRELCSLGLVHISTGMESMLPRQLKLYRKGYSQDDIFRAVELADTLPLDYQTNVIFWDPWSTPEEAIEHVALLERIRIHEQLTSANFPFYAGVLQARKGTRVYDDITQAGLLRRHPTAFYRFEYDFVDSEVRAFHREVFPELGRRVTAARRLPALWIHVPQLEAAGQVTLAHELREYARRLSTAELEYFKSLVTTWFGTKDGQRRTRRIEEIHEELGGQVARQAAAHPPGATRLSEHHESRLLLRPV